MSDILDERVSEMLSNNRKRIRRNVFMAMAGALVALIAAYCLALPAHSLSYTAYCGHEAHEHDADCYTDILECQLSTEEPQTATHTHGDDCYETEQVLVCGFAEVSAAPSQANEDENSISDDDSAATETDNADASAHIHTDACYEPVTTLVCGLDEGQEIQVGPHVHSESCYRQEFTCTLDEHVHTLECYSNPEADLESAATWEATLPAANMLTGMWEEDLITVAESQLNYAESTANYIVTEDDETKGYTRYGAWYGDAYGDWCAMFVSFCLHYAGIDEAAFPQEANCQKWIELLASEDYQLYYPVGSYADSAAAVLEARAAGNADATFEPAGVLDYIEPNEPYEPMVGDIVFLNWDNDAASDHVGIVAGVLPATEAEPAKIVTIEGNAGDKVAYREYAMNDASIMGYGLLPVNPEGQIATYDSNDVSVISDSTVVPTGTTYYYGKNGKYFYQDSSHRINGGIVATFVLVPYSTKDDGLGFTPTSGWTAKSQSNYIVTYCCDLKTSVGTSPETYTSYLLEESRISDPTLQNQLAAIVAHSYPFISEADMKAELKAAGVPLDDVVGASEYLAAVQWAIWELTTLNETFTGASESSFSGFKDSYFLARLTNVGLTNSSKIQTQCKAIKDYLLALPSYPGALDLAGYDVNVVHTADDLYSLSVTVDLNRAMRDDEALNAILQSNGKTSDVIAVQEGQSQITLTLEGLTEDELNNADVKITGDGSHMQAYHFNAEGKQDMLGGRWEAYPLDLSFTLASETTSVAVTKSWTDADVEHPDSVEVQLVRNGVDYGEPISLSESTGWSYVWNDLPKFDYEGNEYEYTVNELVPNGYQAVVNPAEVGTTSINVWKSVDSFANGGTYVIASKLGALGTNSAQSTALEWQAYDVSSADATSDMVKWTATSSGSGFALTNQGNGMGLTLDGSSLKFDGSGSVFYLTADRKLYAKSRYTTYYMTGIDNSVGKTTTSASAGTVFTIYELQVEEVPDSDHGFLITNSPITTTEVSVTKEWIDTQDPDRPESVTVALLANDEEIGTVQLTEEGSWTHTWTDLPLEDDFGTLIAYSVLEEDMSGYDVAVTGEDNRFTITNTKIYYILPETGGIGTVVPAAAGAALIVVGLACLLGRRRHEI